MRGSLLPLKDRVRSRFYALARRCPELTWVMLRTGTLSLSPAVIMVGLVKYDDNDQTSGSLSVPFRFSFLHLPPEPLILSGCPGLT